MSEAGPEAKALAERAGSWNVTFTMWPAPGAKAMVTQGLVAERTMIGPFLQEVMHPGAGASVPDFQRLDYLSYDRIEGRWKYVAMDTRFPVSIMPAWSLGAEQKDKIAVHFEPLGFPGFGQQVEGQLMRSTMLLIRNSPDHDIKQQFFTLANGTGVQWLAVQYEYTRKH